MDDLDSMNPPAFPAQHVDLAPFERGMMLRDWFAGMAMQGMLAHPGSDGKPEHFAIISYDLADAMLAERNK